MNITANNVREALFGLLALAGELPKDIKINGISRHTIENQLSECKKGGLLKIDKTHNRIRVRSPKGLEYLKSYSDELYAHYMMLTNGHRFKTDEKKVIRQQQMSKTILIMIASGYEIDGLSIVYSPNQFGTQNQDDVLDQILDDGILGLPQKGFMSHGEIIPVADTISTLSDKNFITSKYLKEKFPTTSRINFSALTGLMITGEHIYEVFYMGEESRIRKQAEMIMSGYINELLNKSTKNFPGILITDDIEALYKRRAIQDEVLSSVHICTPSPDIYKLILILEEENWREKLLTALYGSYEPNMFFDGTINGIPSIELLSGQFERLKTIKKIAGKNTVNVICFEWEEKLVKKITKGMDINLQVLTPEQEDILFNFIREKE